MPTPVVRANLHSLKELAETAELVANDFLEADSVATRELRCGWESSLKRLWSALNTIEDSVERYKDDTKHRWIEDGHASREKFESARDPLHAGQRPSRVAAFRNSLSHLFPEPIHGVQQQPLGRRSDIIRRQGLDYTLVWAAGFGPSEWTIVAGMPAHIFDSMILETTRSDLQLSTTTHQLLRDLLAPGFLTNTRLNSKRPRITEYLASLEALDGAIAAAESDVIGNKTPIMPSRLEHIPVTSSNHGLEDRIETCEHNVTATPYRFLIGDHAQLSIFLSHLVDMVRESSLWGEKKADCVRVDATRDRSDWKVELVVGSERSIQVLSELLGLTQTGFLKYTDP